MPARHLPKTISRERPVAARIHRLVRHGCVWAFGLALGFSACGALAPATAQSPEPSGWLAGASYFEGPVADLREPRTGLMFVTTNLFDLDKPPGEGPRVVLPDADEAARERQVAAMLGGQFTIWQGGLSDNLGLLFGFQGGVTARFRLDTSANDLLGSDWTLALPVEASYRRWSARARLLHWSSHLGDELADLTGASRIKFTYEALDFLAGFQAWPFLRVYGGGSAVIRSITENDIRVDGRPISDAGHFQLGAEAHWLAAPGRGVGVIAGIDWKKEDRSDWRSQTSVVGGFEARRGDQMVRLMGRVFDGPSPLGQFFLSEELFYGIEISVRW